jgi:hypothetical protein
MVSARNDRARATAASKSLTSNQSKSPCPHWRQIGVNQIWVILFIPGMELEDQFAVAKYPIIPASVLMLRKRVAGQQLLIPPATRPYIAHRD